MKFRDQSAQHKRHYPVAVHMFKRPPVPGEPDQNFCRNENESLVFLRVAMTALVLVGGKDRSRHRHFNCLKE
jgi:hypothetical protein